MLFHTFHTIDSGISLTINDYIYYKLCLLRTIVIISTYELLFTNQYGCCDWFLYYYYYDCCDCQSKKKWVVKKNMTKLGPVGNPFTELVLRGRWPLRLKDHTMQHREKKHLQHFFRNMMSWGAQCDHSLKYGMVREVWTWIGAFDPAFYPLAVGVWDCGGFHSGDSQ